MQSNGCHRGRTGSDYERNPEQRKFPSVHGAARSQQHDGRQHTQVPRIETRGASTAPEQPRPGKQRPGAEKVRHPATVGHWNCGFALHGADVATSKSPFPGKPELASSAAVSRSVQATLSLTKAT